MTDNSDAPPTAATTAGWILLSHPVHGTISSQEMAQALPPDTLMLPRREVVIDPLRDVSMQDAHKIDWADAREQTDRALREKLKPELDRSPGYHVAYFGAAPIPLAMFLGFRVGTWTAVRPFQKRHDARETRDWRWKGTVKTVTVEPTQGMPHDHSKAAGDVIVRVATSHPIDPHDTLEVVPEPLAEISISTSPMDPDALDAPADIEAVAIEFEKVLDAIANHFPNAKCVHVFASVPVGMAFRLGASISATKHLRVRTYQYLRHATPRYTPAIVLQEAGERVAVLDDISKSRAVSTRAAWEEERLRLASFAATLERQNKNAKTWLEKPLFEGIETVPTSPRLATLPPLWKVGFDQMHVAQEPSDLTEFRYDVRDRAWQFGDGLLAGIARHVGNDEDLRRAGRLFLLHEGVHEVSQGVTSATSPRIGRFPKVLEEVDYLADVWAMAHDYVLLRDTGGRPVDVRAHMLQCVDAALGSFWGFDDLVTELEEVQVRRLHRYLIWTWQRLRLERATSREAEVLTILFDRPMIELAGPRIVTHRERIYFDLDPRHVESPEIMVLHGNRARRCADGPSTPISAMLEGFRRRDSARIRDGLQGVFDQTRESS